MNTRSPKSARRDDASDSVAMLLLEFEIPKTTGFAAFEQHLDAQLAEIEERYAEFVTRNSFAGSIGR